MLSDNEIIELIREKTFFYLRTADYSTLRQDCLNQKAPVSVASQIQAQINQIIQNEKEHAYLTLLNQAYEQQRQEDLKEEHYDKNESQKEAHQSNKLNMEHLEIRDKVQFYQHEIEQQETASAQLNSLINAFSEQIEQLQFASNTTHEHDEQPNVHGQQRPHNLSQEHSHSHRSSEHHHIILIAAQSSPNYKTERQELILQQNQIIAQRQEVLKQLTLHNKELTKLTKRQAEIEQILNQLPQKECARRERAIARNRRILAQQSSNSPIDQLSQPNYSLLQDNIRIKNEKKDSQKQLMLEKVNQFAYQEYLHCLMSHLNTQNPLNFQEIEALKQIANYMSQYLTIKIEEQNLENNLKNTVQSKNTLNKTLNHYEDRLANLILTNPMLPNQNLRLNGENQKLTQTIKERLEYRNKLLMIDGVILLLTIASILPLFLTELTIAIFIPAALLAVVTTGLFIASLIYTAQNNSDKQQLKQNQTTIEHNLEKIKSQNNEVEELKTITIPEIKNNLNAISSETSIQQKKIIETQKRATYFLCKAKQVDLGSLHHQDSFYTPLYPVLRTPPSTLDLFNHQSTNNNTTYSSSSNNSL